MLVFYFFESGSVCFVKPIRHSASSCLFSWQSIWHGSFCLVLLVSRRSTDWRELSSWCAAASGWAAGGRWRNGPACLRKHNLFLWCVHSLAGLFRHALCTHAAYSDMLFALMQLIQTCSLHSCSLFRHALCTHAAYSDMLFALIQSLMSESI